MSVDRAGRLQLAAVVAVLVVLQFYLRPRLGDSPILPDFLLLVLMLIAMRSHPGTGAIAGLVIGVVADALTPARFGAGVLAYTVVGYLASWSRAVFFADNLLVNAGMFAGGLWLRNALLLLVSGTARGGLAHELVVTGPLEALTTAAAGWLVLYAAREWLGFRLDL